MIYTLTCNPSLDYRMDLNNLQLSRTNRSEKEVLAAGGKGINVSLMLSILGLESKALGFAAGFTGEEILRQIGRAGLCGDFVMLPDGQSRINVKLRNRIGQNDLQETEINAGGPAVDEDSVEKLMNRIDSICAGDTLVLSGSLPGSLPDTFYGDIMRRLYKRAVDVVVDAAGSLLTNTLEYHPFLIKPNQHELEQLYDVKLIGRRDAIPYAADLQQKGACNVLVSFGKNGALLYAEGQKIYETDAPKGKLENAVGSGDCMVAGFLAGYQKWHDYRKVFRLAVSAGSANAFSDAFASRDEVLAVYDTLIVS